MNRLLRLAPLALLLIPRTTQACEPDPCFDSDKWQSFALTSTVVATDGVLVIDGRRGSETLMTDTEALAYLSADVTADGQPLAGTLEAVEGWHGLIWRPDAPLPAGAELSVTLTVDNESIADDGCEPWQLALGPFAATVADDPMPPLGDVSASASGELKVYETIELDSMVCCDDAYPYYEYSCDTEVAWSTGFCAPTRGLGVLRTIWGVDLQALAPELAGNLGWRVVTDEGEHPTYPGSVELGVSQLQPHCGHIELRNFATGEVTVLEEQCFGDDLVDSLGMIDLDPSAALEAECSGEPYVCDASAEEWDPDNCEPYGDGDGDGDGDTEGGPGADDSTDESGCSCTTDSQSPTPWAAAGLLLLLGLVRRRAGE